MDDAEVHWERSHLSLILVTMKLKMYNCMVKDVGKSIPYLIITTFLMLTILLETMGAGWRGLVAPSPRKLKKSASRKPHSRWALCTCD